jgi:hypothetical protein
MQDTEEFKRKIVEDGGYDFWIQRIIMFHDIVSLILFLPYYLKIQIPPIRKKLATTSALKSNVSIYQFLYTSGNYIYMK